MDLHFAEDIVPKLNYVFYMSIYLHETITSPLSAVIYFVCIDVGFYRQGCNGANTPEHSLWFCFPGIAVIENLKDDIHLDLKIHSYTYTVNIRSKAAYINRSYHSWVNVQE